MAAERVYVVGLTMAGAISAGAYTAGVLDMLARALAAHEAERRAGRVGWRVVLKAVSGASAGGVSGPLGVAALIRGMETREETYLDVVADPLDAPGARPTAPPLRYPVALGPLHDVWVSSLRLYDAVGGGFLGRTDLDRDPAHLFSALDGEALDRAADAALDGVVWARAPYGWIAEPLDLFLTATNVGGVPHEVRFGASSKGHRMAAHANVRHFRVSGLGGVAIGCRWLDAWRDDGISLALGDGTDVAQPIDFRRRSADRRATAWTELRETALATGAFPGGLPARFVRAETEEYVPADGRDGVLRAKGGAWPIDIDPIRGPTPEWGAAGAAGDATYVALDGGMTNNEPFELARFAIRAPERPEAAPTDPDYWRLRINPRDALTADRAVIMVDPFPEGPSFLAADPANPAERALFRLIGPALGALIDQARFKPGELAAAADPGVRSRYLIAPRREGAGGPADAEGEKEGANAIASGLLGGFGGFFDEAFRRHDFVLGQHNCLSFLRKHFALAEGNPLFTGAAAPDEARAAERAVLAGLDTLPEAPEPAWPRMPESRRDRAFEHVRRRLDRVFEAALGQNVGPRLMRWLYRRLWNNVALDIVHESLTRRIEAALIARDQIALDLDALAGDPRRRRALAALVAPGPHLRTVWGVARGLDAEDARAAGRRPPEAPAAATLREVEALVAALSRLPAGARHRLKSGRVRHRPGDPTPHPSFHIEGYGPGWLRRLIPGLEITDDLSG